MIKKHQPQTLGTHYKKAFKFRFYPESEDIVALQQTFGCARFVYNKVLDYSIKHYASRQHTVTDDYGDLIIIPNMKYKPLSSTDRINYITELKILYPWLKEVTSIALLKSMIGLNNAYNKFFDNVKTFIKADRYYPSSKLCSQPNCGYIHHALKLEDRAWQCPDCGTRHDRAHNAAVNLYNYDENNAKVIIKKVLAYHSKMKKNNIGLNIKSDNNSLQLTQYKNKSAPGTVVDAYGEHVIPKFNFRSCSVI